MSNILLSHRPLTGTSPSLKLGKGSTQARLGAPERWGPVAQAWWTAPEDRVRTTWYLGALPVSRRRNHPEGKKSGQVGGGKDSPFLYCITLSKLFALSEPRDPYCKLQKALSNLLRCTRRLLL